MKNVHSIIIFFFFVLAFLLRTWSLGSVPPNPSLDEVSIGYNAFSILHTGRDEYGTRFPILLRAYDDWRPAVYVYLVLPFVALGGLSTHAVRIPSVLLSILSIFTIFRIAQLLGRKYLNNDSWAVWALAFITLSPWHIYLSRLGHEVNLGFTLFTFGVYLLMVWLVNHKYTYVIVGLMFLALSLWGYQSEKVIVPVFLILSGFVLFQELWHYKKDVFMGAAVFLIIAVPVAIVTLGPYGLMRFAGTSAFAPSSPQIVDAQQKHADAVARGDKFASLATSKFVTYLKIFIDNYTSHFNPHWLFFGALREDHKIPYTGLLFWWQGLLCILGVWIIANKMPKKFLYIFGIWILTSPLAASLTTGAPQAMRTYTIVAPLLLLASLGSVFFFRLGAIPVVATIGALLISSFVMVKHYFITFPFAQSDSFQTGGQKALTYAIQIQDSYNRIEIAHQGALYQSYMFYLFLSQYDPRQYQLSGGTKSGGYDESHSIGKFKFGYLPKELPSESEHTLFLYNIADVPSGARIIETFANANGEPAVAVVTRSK